MAKDVADILLIGSGASGGPFAWYLSQVRGLKLVCLEQGDWEGKPVKEDDEFSQRLTKGPKAADTNYYRNGYPYDHRESYWEPVLGHNVGGATVHYGASWHRLRPSDFLQRTLTGVGDDWPIRYEDLAPWYDLNDNFVGVAGILGNPEYPPFKVSYLPLPGADQKTWVHAAADKLGWGYFPPCRAIISVPFHGRNPKDSREAKNRADIVHWPEAIRNGVSLKARATVREITINKQGLADGALYYDAEGKLQEQKARVVVVACNGIGTPRLLLNSKSQRFPHGLANSSGLVGKGLMGHPMAWVVAEFENSDAAMLGAGGPHINEFADMKWRGGAIGSFGLSASGFTGPTAVALGMPPAAVGTLIPASLEQGPRSTGRMLAWGRLHHAAFQQRFKSTGSLMIVASELAEDGNRVELHSTLTDDFGTPAPKLVYKRSENTIKLLTYALERGKELAEAGGATRVVSADLGSKAERTFSGKGAAPGHYMGTARMGTDPKRSVVDKWGRAHDVRNLFVIDGSVFTTASSIYPTSSIQAMGLRIADYCKTNAKQILTT